MHNIWIFIIKNQRYYKTKLFYHDVTFNFNLYLFIIFHISIQHYVINFVSDLRQVRGFLRVLRFPPRKKNWSPWHSWNIVESGGKHHIPNPRNRINWLKRSVCRQSVTVHITAERSQTLPPSWDRHWLHCKVDISPTTMDTRPLRILIELILEYVCIICFRKCNSNYLHLYMF